MTKHKSMPELRIDGYPHVLVPNGIWYRNGTPTQCATGETVQTYNALLLKKYTMPRKAEVLECARKCAQEMGKPEKDTFLQHILREEIPDEIIDAIRDGRALPIIEKHIRYPDAVEGSSYVGIHGGTFAADVQHTDEFARHDFGMDAFESFLHKKGINDWGVSLALDNGTLPLKSDVEFLMRHRVTGSDVLIVHVHYCPYEYFCEDVMKIYNVLKSPDNIRALSDRTDIYREFYACRAVKNATNEIVNQNIARVVSGTIVSQIISAIEEVDKHPDDADNGLPGFHGFDPSERN